MDWLTKENLSLGGVIILFIWNAVNGIFSRLDRKNKTFRDLAFDIAKERVKRNPYQDTLVAHYFLALRALKKISSGRSGDYEKFVIDTDKLLIDKLEHLEDMRDREIGLIRTVNTLIESEQKRADFKLQDCFEKKITWNSIFLDFWFLLKKSIYSKVKRGYIALDIVESVKEQAEEPLNEAPPQI